MTQGDGDAGTVLDLDADGLGWIQLDDGRKVRFGRSACVRFAKGAKIVGERVRVTRTRIGLRGVLTASEVVPFADVADEPATRWSSVADEHPTWSDVAGACFVPRLPVPPPIVGVPDAFEGWAGEIGETAPTAVDLLVPGFRGSDPISPTLADDFAYGHVAFLDEPTWPSCARCKKQLDMCFQLSAATLAPWLPGRGGLVAMYCFVCCAEFEQNGYVRFVMGAHAVSGPRESASGLRLRPAQRVRLGPPRRCLPSGMWYRYRSSTVDDTASAQLFGFGRDSDERVSGVEGAATLDEVGELFDDWAIAHHAARDHLGGAAAWDQDDATPTCPHGPMRLLVDWNGDQFLDAALHVFACPLCPDLAWVAEF